MLFIIGLAELTDKFISLLYNLMFCAILLIFLVAGIIWVVKNPDKFMRFLSHFFK